MVNSSMRLNSLRRPSVCYSLTLIKYVSNEFIMCERPGEGINTVSDPRETVEFGYILADKLIYSNSVTKTHWQLMF